MIARQQSAQRSLRLMMAATIIVPLILFGFAAWQHYRSISKLADERIERSLDIAAEQAEKVFQSIEIVLSSVGEITQGRTDQTIRLYQAQLSERLRTMVSATQDVRSIWLFDRDGKPLVTSSMYPAPDLNNSERDYFVAQREGDAGTYVGTILKPKVGSEIFFSVSQRRYDSSGEFSGVSAIAISPSVFERFYERLAQNSSASYAMIRADGVVLARYPSAASPGIVLPESSGFRQTISRKPEGGEYTTVSGLDGYERRFNVRKLGKLPLYVTSSLEESSIRWEWLNWTLLQLAVGIPVTLLLLIFEYLALRRTMDFYGEVSRREAAEASLRQAQKMEAVGQLTGGIAHDFNNLLTIIIGNLQLLSRQLPDSERFRTKVSAALNGAERAAQLTRRLLAFSRKQPLDPKLTDVDRLISRMSELLGRSLGERHHIEVVRGGGLWQVEVDRTELESAIINLCVNARDASPEGGKITIETANAFLDDTYCKRFDDVHPGQYVQICVSDNGSGMPAEVANRAFEPFFTTKQPGLGTGLGLSQVYGFAKQSGGHVQIYSEPGLGTSVKIYLPRSLAKQAESQPEALPEQLSGKNETILVVEDDDGVRTYLEEALGQLNYRVLSAPGGAVALQTIEGAQRIDLLLTDVVMPGMNGRELAESAIRKQPGLKVLFMTGYSRNAIVHHGRLDPGVALIQKPISERELAERLRKILDAV